MKFSCLELFFINRIKWYGNEERTKEELLKLIDPKRSNSTRKFLEKAIGFGFLYECGSKTIKGREVITYKANDKEITDYFYENQGWKTVEKILDDLRTSKFGNVPEATSHRFLLALRE